MILDSLENLPTDLHRPNYFTDSYAYADINADFLEAGAKGVLASAEVSAIEGTGGCLSFFVFLEGPHEIIVYKVQ